jgi:hypothetical protein
MAACKKNNHLGNNTEISSSLASFSINLSSSAQIGSHHRLASLIGNSLSRLSSLASLSFSALA